MVRFGRHLVTLCAVGALLLAGGCGQSADASSSGQTTNAQADTDNTDVAEAPDAPEEEPPADAASVGLGTAPPTTKAPTPKKKSPPRRATTEKLPPAPRKPSAGCTKPRYVGTQASRADAKAALTAAAGRTYWPSSAPSIQVPLDLVKATAYQESGWQSNIVACDTGVGLMQVMPGTATYVNERFEKSYNLNEYRDNATIGANYLAWLIKYFGDDPLFKGNYSVDPADCADHKDLCLLNVVIAAYNFGPGGVVTDAGLIFIPNPQYVDNVRSLMTNCECLNW
jgi:hypothetical protein